jgi:hypothetical protein
MPKIGVLAAVVLAGTLTISGSAWAGRPLAMDDADPADPGQFEFEAGAGYEHDSDCKHWDFPFGLAYGWVPGVEVGAGFGGQLEERTEYHAVSAREVCIREHSIGDLVVGAKWQLMESCPLGARHAIAPSVKFPTSDEDTGLGSGETDYDLTWIASRSIGEKTGVHVNLGYSWIGGSDDDVVHYGVALDYQIVEPVQWVGEVSAEKELAGGEDTVVQYNTGFRWNAVERLTVDIAGGAKISGDGPDFTGTVGLTWAFGSKSHENK